nr:serine-rich coiled-coil domain-containing protein 2 isoform X7 [Pelodiscus sinensis]|eukprot:XP_014431603.1 serine-rich coiled-coil domain-containing protein 2 isoform X7 [Pelodiscus sinensis]
MLQHHHSPRPRGCVKIQETFKDQCTQQLMEEKIRIKTSLVSKLPKYGTKSLGSTLQPITNRTAVTLSGNPQSSPGKNCIKHNGTDSMSSFSFNWQKSNKYQLDNQSGRESNSAQNSSEKLVDSEKYSPSQGGFGKDVLTTSSIASKAAKQVNMFVSSTEELNQKSLLGLSSSVKFTKAIADKNESTKHTIGNNLISPDMDYRGGSSLELSPSDSSDGTYMWDEEGLEPIGSVHPCGSYESSEMNSIDILNNLDSCDLEDDDLMLDVDLPEDTPCDNVDYENMNRYGRQDRNLRQQQDGFWKRTPQCWSAQDCCHLGHLDHFPHSKNDLSRDSCHLEPPVDHFEDYGIPNMCQTPRQLVGLPENTVMLDEMTLRHMVQDCTAVKTQLLKLKRLLHQNDETVYFQDIPLSMPSSPDQQDVEPTYKTEDLLNEIRQLKEDLKKKDETIKRLESQLASRCNCHIDGQNHKGMTYTYADKFTQTSCRRNSPQVLQPSCILPSSTDLVQGKLIKTPHIEAHNEHLKQGLHENNDCSIQNAASGSFIKKLNILSKCLNIKDLNECAPFDENLKVNKGAKDQGELATNEDRTPSSFQTATQVDVKDVQTKLAVKSQPLSPSQASQPKTLRASESPNQNALVPPTVAITAPSPTCSIASTEPKLSPLSSATQLQSAASQRNLKSKPSQRISKLHPPTISFVKCKQIRNPKSLLISAEPQIFHSKTNIPRPLAQKKENVQNQSASLHFGDSLASNWHSRLPKPKTH